MGGHSYSDDAYRAFSSRVRTKNRDELFTQNTKRTIHDDMNPYGVDIRESRDSDIHPNSLAIAIALDVTGSMGDIPEKIVKEKLNSLMKTLIDHNINDAAVLFMGVGDHISDKAPLQVGQFESGDTQLLQWLTSLWIEGGGGGQNHESYSLAYNFCANHTSIDCFEKRGQKGFLFTIGDEGCHPLLDGPSLMKIMGYPESRDLEFEYLLEKVQEKYEVFHLHIEQGSYPSRGHGKIIVDFWKNHLKERCILVEDYSTVAEIIATTVAVVKGEELSRVISGFDSDVATKVSTALSKITTDISSTTTEAIEL
ncbi:MAG: VWA domain-containing protein [Vicingus serpentipes]|nr:VWA domain-containing protein [Vicingus serpentipes]